MSDDTAPEKAADRGGEAAQDPIAGKIFALLAERGPGKSICPTEAARAMQETYGKANAPADAWHRYLPMVRQQALHLAREGEIVILRKGKAVDPRKPVKGVIRLALPSRDPTSADS